MKKFLERYQKDIEHLNLKISMIFGVAIEQDISLIKTYSSIEKRGFYIIRNGVKFKCIQDFHLKISLAISNQEYKKE